MTDKFLQNLREVIRFAKIKNMEIACMFTPDLQDGENFVGFKEEKIFSVRCYDSRKFEHKEEVKKIKVQL